MNIRERQWQGATVAGGGVGMGRHRPASYRAQQSAGIESLRTGEHIQRQDGAGMRLQSSQIDRSSAQLTSSAFYSVTPATISIMNQARTGKDEADA